MKDFVPFIGETLNIPPEDLTFRKLDYTREILRRYLGRGEKLQDNIAFVRYQDGRPMSLNWTTYFYNRFQRSAKVRTRLVEEYNEISVWPILSYLRYLELFTDEFKKKQKEIDIELPNRNVVCQSPGHIGLKKFEYTLGFPTIIIHDMTPGPSKNKESNGINFAAHTPTNKKTALHLAEIEFDINGISKLPELIEIQTSRYEKFLLNK